MRKNIGRIAGALFLAVAIALTQIPASYVRAVSSSGDFEREGNTIYGYNGTAQSVTVPSGTTRIASEAFSNQNFLTSVSFPASLEVIENGAFRSCTSITDVVLPSNLTTLESGAFAKCDNLKSFQFSDTLYDLGAGVFSGDEKLASVNLGKNPYFVMIDGALYNKERTKLYFVLSGRAGSSFTVPDSVDEIERYAFWGCKNLKKVTLSSNLSEIPEFAFSNCENLEEVNVPLSVRKISAKAFEDCISLGNVKVPASVITIHDTAFDGCVNLNIISDEGTAAYEFFRNFDRSQSALMAYEDTVSENAIGSYYPVSSKPSASSSSGSKSGSDSSDSAAGGKSDGKKLPQKFDPSRKSDVSKADVWDDYTDDTAQLGKTRVVGGEAVIFPGSFENADVKADGAQVAAYDTSNPAKLPIEEYPTPSTTIACDADGKIARKACYAADSIYAAAVADGTKEIGDLAFARSSLTSVILPDGLTRIGYGAFYHCDHLTKVRIPDSVTYISPEAFANTPFLDNWLEGSGDPFLIVGDGILLGYRGDSANVTIPDSVKLIAGGCFAGHSEIGSVTLGGNVTEIGEGAFYDCTALSAIKGGGKLKKIADRAFLNCPVNNLHIPATVEQIGLGAFDGAASPAVVFEGDSAPALSYEQTSTRLSNEKFRTLALGAVPTAVVLGSGSLKNTVLDENYLGFRGLVVSVPKGLSDSAKEASLLRCSMLPDERGVIKIPDSVTIDGNPYKLISAAPTAFAAYDKTAEDGEGAEGSAAGGAAASAAGNEGTGPDMGSKTKVGTGVSAIILPAALGAIGDYLPSFAFDASAATIEETNPEAAAPATDEKEEEKEKSEEEAAQSYVETVVSGSAYPNAEKITADVADDTAAYRLFVSDKPEDAAALNKAVTAKYGSPVAGQLVPLSLQMVEADTNVPITNFGKRPVKVSVPVSDTLFDQQICAVSLSEDGSLEMHYGTKSQSDGVNYFTFTTSHFSPYGIYAGIGETAKLISEKTAELSQKDESPDTGDHSPIMLVLALFFGALGLALILNLPGMLGGRRKTD